ncbi:LCP family protein [Patescibacteria group bacterium]|nr:LCP family protein [Patescibacteria group bacterium]
MRKFPKLDSIENLPEYSPPDAVKKTKKKGSFFVLKIFAAVLVVVALIGSVFSYKVLSVSKDVFVEFDNKKTSLFQQLKKLILSEDKILLGEEDGRTNVLLLGMGGEGHSGALLTDTIMVASIKFDKETGEKDVALLSIPRDLYVPVQDGRQSKINSVYSIGARDGENEGARLIANVISDITGLPIHYYVRVDFEGFRKVIDALDGVDVEVDRSFVDTRYPTYNYGWQTVEFEKGIHHMDGETALQFSRSRHGVVTEGEGFEGSDFARAERQQKVLQAVQEKALSVNTIANPKKVNDLLGALGDHVRTNVEPWEMTIMFELAKEIHKDDIINKVIDQGENGLVYSSNRGGAYVLIPHKEDFSEVRDFALTIFDQAKEDSVESEILYVLNGTKTVGIASTETKRLEDEGYEVTGTGNARKSDYTQTVIYTKKEDYSDSVRKAKDDLHARIETLDDLSSVSLDVIPSSVSVVIVLGENYS